MPHIIRSSYTTVKRFRVCRQSENWRNTWIGGGSMILNGVTIGKNTDNWSRKRELQKDIPDNVVAVGNPCRVIKRLDKENVENGKRLKFTDFRHINIVVDDIDEGIKYYEQLLEAKPIQIFREFSNIGFARQQVSSNILNL